MPPAPSRRTEPAPYLLGAISPLENALIQRAAELDNAADTVEASQGGSAHEAVALTRFMASEFRALAGELHYWQ